jgi:hypothetical protein
MPFATSPLGAGCRPPALRLPIAGGGSPFFTVETISLLHRLL